MVIQATRYSTVYGWIRWDAMVLQITHRVMMDMLCHLRENRHRRRCFYSMASVFVIVYLQLVCPSWVLGVTRVSPEPN